MREMTSLFHVQENIKANPRIGWIPPEKKWLCGNRCSTGQTFGSKEPFRWGRSRRWTQRRRRFNWILRMKKGTSLLSLLISQKNPSVMIHTYTYFEEKKQMKKSESLNKSQWISYPEMKLLITFKASFAFYVPHIFKTVTRQPILLLPTYSSIHDYFRCGTVNNIIHT